MRMWNNNEYYMMFIIILYYIIFIQLDFINCEFQFLEFNSKSYRAGHFAFNLNGDMIIEYSYEKNRLFYGLKKNGKAFFENNSTIKTYSISNDKNRYNSKNIFVSLKNDKNNQFLLSVAADSIIEIFKLEPKDYEIKENNNYICSNLFSLSSLKNSNYYIIIFLSCDKKIKIQKFAFSGFSFSYLEITNTKDVENNLYIKTVSGFIINEKIIVFYLKSETFIDDSSFETSLGSSWLIGGGLIGKGLDWLWGTSATTYTFYIYYINVYDSNLDLITEKNVIGITKEYINDNIFFKGLPIDDQLMAFCYYSSPSNLTFAIGELTTSYKFSGKIIKEIVIYYNYNNLLNDFIKINDGRLAFIALKNNNPSKFDILLIDLYNDYNNMKIRKYEINLNKKYKISKELELNIYNSYIVLSATVIDYSLTDPNPEESCYSSIFMIFGYINGTDEKINLGDYFMEDF